MGSASGHRSFSQRYLQLGNHLDSAEEYVPGAAFGLNQRRRGRLGLDLPAQPRDLHVDRAVIHLVVVQLMAFPSGPTKYNKATAGFRSMSDQDFARLSTERSSGTYISGCVN